MGSANSKASIEEGKSSTSTAGEQQTTTSSKLLNSGLSSISNVSKMLPTGIMFVFQMLSHVLSDEGDCDKSHKVLVALLLSVLGIACFILCFTDTFTSNGKVVYGIATPRGFSTVTGHNSKIKPSNESSYKIKLKDILHAFLAVLVFAVMALTDKNVVTCLYPSAESKIKKVIQALPVAVGAVSSALFAIFPSKRQGISHPVTSKS